MSARTWHAALLAAVAAAAAAVLVDAQGSVPLPSEPGRTGRRATFRMAEMEPIAIRETPPLRVERVETHELGEGTHAGSPGDVLLTFHGAGFLETARGPRVEFGNGVSLEQTMVSADGDQLFLVLAAGDVRRIEGLRFEAIAVVNPGGLDDESGRATIRATPRALVRPGAGTVRARLVFRNGFFHRELEAR